MGELMVKIDQNGLGHGAVGMLKTWAEKGRRRAEIVRIMATSSPATMTRVPSCGLSRSVTRCGSPAARFCGPALPPASAASGWMVSWMVAAVGALGTRDHPAHPVTAPRALAATLGTGAYALDLLCTNGRSQGRQILSGGPCRRPLDFQDDSRATDGPVFVHRDRLAGLEVSPLGGGEGCKSHRGTLAGTQGGGELDPQECDVEVLLTGWSAISDIPHRPQNTGSGEGSLPSVLAGWPKSELGADDPVAGFVAAPVAPGRASLHPHLLGGRGEGPQGSLCPR